MHRKDANEFKFLSPANVVRAARTFTRTQNRMTFLSGVGSEVVGGGGGGCGGRVCGGRGGRCLSLTRKTKRKENKQSPS